MSQYFEDNKNQDDLGGQATRSGAIAMIARLIIAVVQVVSTIVLARLLAPEDFGIVAIVAALTSFVPMLIDLGLTDSTVQNPRITPAQISALFWISLGMASLVALLLVVAGPVIASIYRQPAIGSIAAAWAVTFILYGLSLQHLALLRRALRYRDIALIEVIGSVGGTGVTIGMAWFGFGYWALIARPVMTGLITAVGSWLCCDWKPGAPKIDAEVKSMLKFGLNVSGGAVVWIGSSSADRAVMGFLYGPALIGFYQNAFMLYENAMQGISMPLHKVGVSALSKLSADAVLFRRQYVVALSTVSFYSMPAFAILAVIASDFVPLLLGSKWAFSGTILSIFALRGILHVVENSQTWILMSLGRADRWLRWAILTGLVQIAAVVAGLPFGVEGVAWAIVIARSAIAIPGVLYAGRLIDLKFPMVLAAIGRQLCGAILTILAGKATLHLLSREFGPITRVSIGVGVCVVTYLSLVVGIFRVTEPLRLASSLFKRLVPVRFHRWLPFTAVAGVVKP